MVSLVFWLEDGTRCLGEEWKPADKQVAGEKDVQPLGIGKGLRE